MLETVDKYCEASRNRNISKKLVEKYFEYGTLNSYTNKRERDMGTIKKVFLLIPKQHASLQYAVF